MSAAPGPAPSVLQKASNGRLSAYGLRAVLADEIRQGGAPALVIIALLVVIFIAELTTGGPLVWGLSRESLSEGRWETLASHVVAHGGITHLLMNCGALLGFTVGSRRLLGFGLSGWARYFGFLALAGLASAALFLLLHPDDGVPMVGASGAICGLWGLVVRCDPTTGEIRSFRSGIMWRGIRSFAVNNMVLFGILFVLVRLSGGAGGLAWEGHLGGFLLGLLIAPWIIVGPTISAEPAATS